MDNRITLQSLWRMLITWIDERLEERLARAGVRGTSLDASYVVGALPAGVVLALDDIGDVDASAPTDGMLLHYDAGAAQWVAVDYSGDGDSSLFVRWEPLTTGTEDTPDLVFAAGDIVMVGVG